MPDLVKIPLAATEYLARFTPPHIGFIANDRPRAVEAVVAALLPFGLRLLNADAVVTGNLAEHKVTFKLPERDITFQIGAEEFRFNKEGSNWVTAEEDAKVLVAAERALLEGSAAKIGYCLVNVGMHMQLLTKPREEVLTRFIPVPFRDWAGRKPMSYGNHLRWADGDLLLDFSGRVANGIFLKFTTRFDGHPSAEEMLQKVKSEEIAIFELLGIQEHTDVK